MFVGLMTPDGIMLEANRSALEAAGLGLEHVLGRYFYDTFWFDHPGNDRRLLREAIVRAASGEASRYDTKVRTTDDTLLDIDFSLQPLWNAAGEVAFLVPSGIVITERKQVEAALRATTEQFSQLADNITDVFWIRSPDMREVHYISAGFERLWGRTPVVHRDSPQLWTEYILAEDRDAVVEAFAGLTRDTPYVDLEYRIVRPDGSIRWVNSRGFQVRDGEGRLVRLTGIVRDITGLKEAAEALRASVDDFRTLAEAMPQMVWITRPDGWNTYFSQQWREYTGLTVEETAGHGWITPFHPDDQLRATHTWAEATRTAGTYSLEARIRRADGVYRWWLVRAVPLRDAAGSILKWFGTCTDIHDLKLAELEVSRSNRALTMLSHCSEAVVRAENEHALLSEVCRVAVEDGGYRMAWVGYAQDDEARSIAPVAHAGEERGFLGDVRVSWNSADPLAGGLASQVILTGQPVVCTDISREPRCDYWWPQAKERGYLGTICLPLRDGARTFGLLVLYAAEIIEASAEELALLGRMADNVAFGIVNLRTEADRERLDAQVHEQAALLDIAHEAIQVLDLEGRITYWNRGAERTYGWNSAEARGRHSIDLLDLEPAKARAARARVRATGEWQGEMIHHTKHGSDITADVRLTLVRDAAGGAKAILALSTDITRKKEIESQLMVSDRMASVGTLAAGVAHEINNPLAAVIANLDYIVESLDGQAWHDMKAPLEDARDAARRVRLIVRDLKIFSGAQSADPETPVSVEAVMESSLRLAWNEIRHRATLVKRFQPVPLVLANEARLGQVFLNLLVNAAQALPEGQLEQHRITVSTRLEDSRVIIEVADTGPGILPERVGRIFDAFYTTKEVGAGIGLGLAISQRIIADMGGRLTVRSIPGEGATFCVALPVADVAAEVAATEVAAAPATGPRGRILLVDDEVLLLRLLTRVLSKEHEVVALSAAKEALARCVAGETFDLILCDLMMPEMTGMELHRELSRVAPDQAARMIFMTGGAFTPAARLFLSDESREHIEKPFDHVDLRAVVRRHLLGPSAAAGPPGPGHRGW
jgi:PAS domain S-box-containing protein